jgi:hypothetical protein
VNELFDSSVTFEVKGQYRNKPGSKKISITLAPYDSGAFKMQNDEKVIHAIKFNKFNSEMYVGNSQNISVEYNGEGDVSLSASSSTSETYTFVANLNNTGVLTYTSLSSTRQIVTITATVNASQLTNSISITLLPTPPQITFDSFKSNMYPGDTQVISAVTSQGGSCSYSLASPVSGVSIDTTSGLLTTSTVPSTNTTITVIATSALNSSISGAIEITLLTNNSTIIKFSDFNSSMIPGDTQTITVNSLNGKSVSLTHTDSISPDNVSFDTTIANAITIDYKNTLSTETSTTITATCGETSSSIIIYFNLNANNKRIIINNYDQLMGKGGSQTLSATTIGSTDQVK